MTFDSLQERAQHSASWFCTWALNVSTSIWHCANCRGRIAAHHLTQRSRMETLWRITFYGFLLALLEWGRGGPRTVWPPWTETFSFFQKHNFSLLTVKFQDIVFLIIDSPFTGRLWSNTKPISRYLFISEIVCPGNLFDPVSEVSVSIRADWTQLFRRSQGWTSLTSGEFTDRLQTLSTADGRHFACDEAFG